MAKKEKIKSRPVDSGPSSGRFFYYSFIVVMICMVALVWLSLLTFSPLDPPSTLCQSDQPVMRNGAGVVGACIAYYIRHWIGAGVYMGLMFLTLAASVLVVGGRIRDVYWRLLGVVLLIVTTSAAIYLRDPQATTDTLFYGQAGVLGKATGSYLLGNFKAFSWLVIAGAFSIGLMLAADNIVLQLPRLGKKVWEHRGEIADAAKSLRPRFLPPATTEARTVTASPRAAAAGAVAEKPKARPADKPSDKPADKSAGKILDKPSGQVAAAPNAPTAPDKSAAPEPPRVSIASAPPAKLPEPATKSPPPPSAPVSKSEQVSSIAAAKPPSPAPAVAPKTPARPVSPTNPTGVSFVLPSADLLTAPTGGYIESQEEQAEIKRAVLQQTLNDFNVGAEVVGHQTGPVITLFELSLAPGVKVAQVANLATDVARALAVPGVRIVSPIPGKDTVGVEVPNMQKEIVRIRELMSLAPDADKKYHLPLYLGKDAGGGAIVADLGSMPHMLIAGTTGSGKSVCINTIIISLLMTRTPQEVRLILVDPKMVEMAAFENIPHLLCPIVNDMKRAEEILEWAASKMDERYELLREANVKNIAQFNRLGKEEIYKRFEVTGDAEEAKAIPTRLPYYVVIIDELADLIMTSSKEVEGHIIRIAQKARAVGIHLILATQRPSVNVVTGLIKSNMPCRISFRVASRQESRIVLDQNGADVLMGQGDMLFLQPGTSSLVRAQGTYVDDSEIKTVVTAVKATGEPQYENELMRLGTAAAGDGGGERDELFDKGVEIVLHSQRGSVSLLQRRLQIGYSRASRIIDQMADAGLLGDYKGSQARECLLTLEDWQAMKASIQADQSGASAANGEPTSV